MKTLSNAAIDVLSGGLEIAGSNVVITRQLDRKLYVEVNAALVALGGEWKRGQKAHVFAGDPTDALADVLTDGGFYDKKRDMQQFFTPAPLARELVGRLDVRGKVVLEPSAGEGALVAALLAAGAKRVVTFEKDPKLCDLLAAKFTTDQLDLTNGDFLATQPRPCAFSVGAMNPPFTKGQDVDHVLRALSMIAVGGKLAAIMSAGVEFRSDKRTLAFRDLVASCGGTIERLPEDSFVSSGTNVRTVIVEMMRR